MQLQNLRSITVMGSYFYQITIKNAPRHKLLEEKLKNFPSDNLIFNMLSTQNLLKPSDLLTHTLKYMGRQGEDFF